MSPIDSLPPRLVDKIRVDQASECWEWLGCVNHAGYGLAYIGDLRSSTPGKMGPAHKVVYEAIRGLVPVGMQLDHICHRPDDCVPPCAHRRCVNPAHLEPVTAKANTRRSSSLSAANATKTRCVRGHALTAANVVIVQRGARQERHCRACRKIRANEWISNPQNRDKRRASNREYMRQERRRRAIEPRAAQNRTRGAA